MSESKQEKQQAPKTQNELLTNAAATIGFTFTPIPHKKVAGNNRPSKAKEVAPKALVLSSDEKFQQAITKLKNNQDIISAAQSLVEELKNNISPKLLAQGYLALIVAVMQQIEQASSNKTNNTICLLTYHLMAYRKQYAQCGTMNSTEYIESGFSSIITKDNHHYLQKFHNTVCLEGNKLRLNKLLPNTQNLPNFNNIIKEEPLNETANLGIHEKLLEQYLKPSTDPKTNTTLIDIAITAGVPIESLFNQYHRLPQLVDKNNGDIKIVSRTLKGKLYFSYTQLLQGSYNKLNNNLETIIQGLLIDFYSRHERLTLENRICDIGYSNIERFTAEDKKLYHYFLQQVIKTVEALSERENIKSQQQLLALQLLQNQVSKPEERKTLNPNNQIFQTNDYLPIHLLHLIDSKEGGNDSTNKKQFKKLINNYKKNSNSKMRQGEQELALFLAKKHKGPYLSWEVVDLQFNPQKPDYSTAIYVFNSNNQTNRGLYRLGSLKRASPN